MQLLKCKHHNQYKGIRAPKCNGGNPCVACVKKFGGAVLMRWDPFMNIRVKPSDVEAILTNAIQNLDRKIEYGNLYSPADVKLFKKWRKLALAMADVVE